MPETPIDIPEIKIDRDKSVQPVLDPKYGDMAVKYGLPRLNDAVLYLRNALGQDAQESIKNRNFWEKGRDMLLGNPDNLNSKVLEITNAVQLKINGVVNLGRAEIDKVTAGIVQFTNLLSDNVAYLKKTPTDSINIALNQPIPSPDQEVDVASTDTIPTGSTGNSDKLVYSPYPGQDELRRLAAEEAEEQRVKAGG